MAKIIEHPSYKCPSIVEALCEIHFQFPEGRKWDPALFGEVFSAVLKDYPVLEPLSRLRLQQTGRAGELVPTEQMQTMRYKSKSGKKLIQLSRDHMTVNELPKYPGWGVMKKDIKKSWTSISNIVEPESITRIGLRYINRIDRTVSEEKASQWLKANEYVPESVLNSLPGFLSRVEVRTGINSRVIVTVGEIMMDEIPGQGLPIVLDIDAIMEKNLKADVNILAKEIEKLHEVVWDIFKVSKTSRFDKVLKGGK